MSWTAIIVVVAGAAVAFAVLWRKGQIARFATYLQETREELKRCTWPSMDELKGSTVVVMISTALLGLFTVFVDFIFSWVLQRLT